VRYRPYGKTGWKVSRLGFGAMRLPARGGKVNLAESVRLMHRAFDHGVNIVDTLCFYCGGLSETAVGRAVKGRRDKVFIQTKCQTYKPLEKGETWGTRFLATLKAMKIEYLDAYLMHSLTMDVFEKVGEQFVEAMQPFLRDGRLRFLGFSSHDTPENIAKFVKTGVFQVMLVQYNLIESDKARVLGMAHRRGIATAVMGPVGGGRLVGPPDFVDAKLARRGFATPEIALRYVFSNPNIDVAFSGMNTPEMVDQNARVASLRNPLSSEAGKRLAAKFRRKARRAKLFCSGCRYCMPCPAGVNIPRNLALLSNARLYKAVEWARNEYKSMKPEMRASNCKACGKCLKKCPQKIPIIDRLKEVVEELEACAS